ncbi:MAG: LPS assembly lipoprotein LptE [Gammaproteobacteria bacterium]
MYRTRFSISLWANSHRILLAVTLILLAGCGFQLRGTDLTSLGLIKLSGVSGEARASYSEHFRTYGANIAEKGEVADGIVISIEAQRSERRPIATSANITSAQYKLRQELDFVVYRNEDIFVPASTVFAERIYSVDSFNLGGSFEEQQMLLNDLRGDLARQILQHIESAQLESGL